MIGKFIKLYTPFICAIIACIHGVLFLLKYQNITLNILNDLSGHSILLLWFIWIHSKRMCKWYKLSIMMLFIIHIMNVVYYITGVIPVWIIIYGGLILNIASVMFWLIFRITYKATKVIHLACKHSETE